MAQTIALEGIISCSVFRFHEDTLIFRFHELRHTSATNALEHGMDAKTLSTIIGHVSSATTLNVYAHVTNDMQKQAAVKIDQVIGKVEAPMESSHTTASRAMTDFKSQQGKHRY